MSECKTILISGATGGIGRAAALQLAGLGHQVAIIGRSRARCAETANEIRRATGRPVDWLLADLSSLEEVRRAAEEIRARYDRLDVLINNAGAVYMQRTLTPEGIEQGWAVNYFQAFLLSRLLLDLLQASTPARIINLSSIYHWAARLDPDNLAERGPYIGWEVYGQTKLAMLYFTYELARRLEGSGVTVNAIHPGLVKSGIGKNRGRLLSAVFGVVDLFAVPAEEGAAGLVNLAVNPSLEGVSGKYFSGMKMARSSPASQDRETGRRLWERSLERVGEIGEGGTRRDAPLRGEYKRP